MANSTGERSGYRPEIQGIRTIGALLVAVFHIWFGRVSGGVDVFFVISGFLITGSLYREIQRSQTLDVIAFWARIAKRIAPLAYLVLALTLGAAIVWMPHSRQTGFLNEIVYSAFHLENLKLMMNSVDYLAREEAPSPVQQFWALSVQVQFYAVWPFVLLAIALAARRFRMGGAAYMAALVAVFVASLAYSIIETTRDPSPTYFNTLARVWEFALGGILAIALPRLSVPPKLRVLAGWVGLAMVVSCGFLLPASASFPGYVALWPTVGAALVLISGGSGSRFGADRLLSSKPLVALGEISFSFYLWHWPVLIFFMILRGHTGVGPLGGLFVIAVAIAGAYCTNRWVEQPILHSSLGTARKWHVHAMGMGLAIPVLMVALTWMLVNQAAESRQQEALARLAQEYPGGASPMSLATAVKPGIPVYPTTAAVKGKHANRCQQNLREPAVTTCVYGIETNARKTIALVGGSHSEHWLPALEKLAFEHEWRIVAVTKSGCPFAADTKNNPSCLQWNEDVQDTILQLRPDAVFTTSTRRGALRFDRPTESVPTGYREQWKRLARNNIRVVAVRDTPRMKDDVLECVQRNADDIAKCALPRDILFYDVDPATTLNPRPDNVSFIDLTDRFCDEQLCPPVGGNVLIYRDAHHMTIEYSRTLASPLGERMRHVRPDLFSINVQERAGSPQSMAGVP
ncbi:acyltransferase family protein [Microvirga soli]|uniref:acyltransferase family protein n=1 Tax=Microvirga soli TaxID=1854496 RepID=UPI0019200ECC|nr:acyltransferase family protein [Microvirga soli]